jgi:predicted nucleic acid-binding protein
MGGWEVKLIDTSSWIDYLRSLDSEASKRVEKLVLEEEAAWCDITLVELWNGVRGAKEKRDLAELEKEITLLAVDSAVWRKAKQLRLWRILSSPRAPRRMLWSWSIATGILRKYCKCQQNFDSYEV